MSTSVRTPPPPPAPTPVDPGQSALAFVRSMADPQLQGEILRNEQLYAPQYTNLELQQINQLMSGSEGLPGVLELQRQAAEQAGGIERSILGQQRAADIADVERLGGRASAAFLQANPQLASALDRAEQLQAGGMDVDSQIRELSRMGIDPVQAQQIARGEFDATAAQVQSLVSQGIPEAQAAQIARGGVDQSASRIRELAGQGIPQARAARIAQSELGGGLQQAGMGQLQAGAGEAMLQQQGMDFIGRGGALTPLQQRAVEQQARSAGVARGRELDSSSITNEIANRLAQEMQVEQQNVSMGAGLLGQGFGMQQQRLGAASGIYGQDLSRAQANAAMQQQARLANQAAAMEGRAQGLGAETNIMGTQAQLASQDASFLQQARLASQAAALQGRGQGIEALLGLGGQRASMAAQDASMGQQAALANQDARLRQQGLGMQGLLGLGQLQQGQQQANRSFAMNLIGARQATASDPFQAILGRPSQAPGMGMAQSQFGANLAQQQMGPNLFDPNAGINLALQQNQNLANYQSNIFGSQASLAGAQSQARGAMLGGLFSGLGSAIGCWVAREVYGEDNPKWRIFREWLTFCAPKWFYNLYVKHGERFAAWLKGKHVLKGIIRHWMDGRVETMFKLNEREETC